MMQFRGTIRGIFAKSNLQALLVFVTQFLIFKNSQAYVAGPIEILWLKFFELFGVNKKHRNINDVFVKISWKQRRCHEIESGGAKNKAF